FVPSNLCSFLARPPGRLVPSPPVLHPTRSEPLASGLSRGRPVAWSLSLRSSTRRAAARRLNPWVPSLRYPTDRVVFSPVKTTLASSGCPGLLRRAAPQRPNAGASVPAPPAVVTEDAAASSVTTGSVPLQGSAFSHHCAAPRSRSASASLAPSRGSVVTPTALRSVAPVDGVRMRPRAV